MKDDGVQSPQRAAAAGSAAAAAALANSSACSVVEAAAAGIVDVVVDQSFVLIRLVRWVGCRSG